MIFAAGYLSTRLLDQAFSFPANPFWITNGKNGNCIFHEKFYENSCKNIPDPSKIITIEHYNG